MAESIKSVLTTEELGRLNQFQGDITDRNAVMIVENVSHIACDAKDYSVSIHTYTSLNNPYLNRISTQKLLCPIRRRDEDELRVKRDKHRAYTERRDHIIRDELALRTYDVLAHKYYLSQDAGGDVGLMIAAAHWLKNVSGGYYDLSHRQHHDLGINFAWKGMERAVIISAPNKSNLEYFIIVMERDFFVEELLAQATGGVLDAATGTVDLQKAAITRTRIDEMCGRYFCILRA